MKKTILFLLLIGFVSVINSCDYDDGNDVDILKPNDSTATGVTAPDLR